MQTAALLISDDLILRSQVKPVLNEANIQCQCCEVANFERVIARGKVECILLDIADPAKFSDVISKLRAGKFNRYAIVVALADDAHRTVLSRISGANFFVSRSARLVPDLKQTLNSARALIIHEKRRYYRHPVNLGAEVFCDGQAVRVKMVDLSARGACLDGQGLPDNKKLRLRFVLPGSSHRLDLDVVVAWVRGTNTGVEFTSLNSDTDKTLKTWLREKEVESSAVSCH
jgi:hypothetical protein